MLLEGWTPDVLHLPLCPHEGPGRLHQALGLRGQVPHRLLAPGHRQVAQGLVLGATLGAHPLGQATWKGQGQGRAREDLKRCVYVLTVEFAGLGHIGFAKEAPGKGVKRVHLY